MTLCARIRIAWRRFVDPVVQDQDALMFTEYRGVTVQMRPVMDPHDHRRVRRWIADPTQAAAVDEIIARRDSPSAPAPAAVTDAQSVATAPAEPVFSPSDAGL